MPPMKGDMMPEASRSLFFRKRTILGGALVAGIGLGVWLGLPFKGFLGLGHGSGQYDEKGETGDKKESSSAQPASVSIDSQGELPVTIPDVVKVLIDERDFLLRQADEDVPITLSNLIHLIKQAPGNEDGVRLRIYEKSSARASAEESLKQALVDAGIPDSAIFWVPTPVKDFDTRPSPKAVKK